jgi:hypothetical protein
MSDVRRGVVAVLAALGLLALLPTAAQAKWLRAESPRFIVYSDRGESVLREYVIQMETFDSLLRARHGLPETGAPPRKLPIYLVRDRDDLQRTWHKAGEAVAGYYTPGGADTFAVAVLEGDDDDSVTIKHEYTHHFMLQNFPGAYPAWMVEGYAEYYSMTRIRGAFVEVGRVNDWRSSDLRDGAWLKIADVLSNKRGAGSRNWSDFYAESWLLTHYLMSDPARFQQFRAYASAVGKGADPVVAMTQATDLSIDALDQVLRKYMNTGLAYTQYKRTDFTLPPITVTTLPPSADALLLDRLQLVAHYYKDTNASYLPMIRGKAAKFAGDQLATLALGQAEMELGDPAAGRALLEDWIRTHPGDAEAMFVLGGHLLAQAREEKDGTKSGELMAAARDVLRQAAAVTPTDYRILYAYAQARRGEAGYPTVETQTLLVTAYKQAPQVVGLRYELVQVLMARRHWREAEALLRPLVNDPHGGDVAAKARQLMERVQAALVAGG